MDAEGRRAARRARSGASSSRSAIVDALLAEVHNDAPARFIGARCDTATADIERDEFGRIHRTSNGAGCKGVNPGALMIVLHHRLRRDAKPFVVDAQDESNTDEIWNQPAFAYTVNRFAVLSTSEAANLVASGARQGALSAYAWNGRARGFVFVDVSVHWVTERGPNATFVDGASSARRTRMTAVLELDRPPAPAARIIGGELVDDHTAGTNRLRNHPFVWTALGPGPEVAHGEGHNPHIKPSVVMAMARMGQR